MKLRSFYFEIISSVFANLSAAWIFVGVGLFPSGETKIIFGNLALGVLCLFFAFVIKSQEEKYD